MRIDELNGLPEIGPDDLVPVFSLANDATRRVTMGQIIDAAAADAGTAAGAAAAIAATPAVIAALTGAGGAAAVGFTPTGVGAVATTVQSALDTFSQKKTGAFFIDNGARVNRLNDRLFVGKSATSYDGKGTPVVKSWVGTPSAGIFEYLESNATFGAYAEQSGLGMFAAARTSDTAGGNAEVSIGMASFAYNDRVGGSSGAWNFYGTALREAGANGSTLGIEIDVANLGATVPIMPANLFPAGVSAGLWIASGGEATNNQHVGTASAAMVILSNDAGARGPVAKFDKGIVIHNQALEGCDGLSGAAVALALARGHAIQWFSNSNLGLGSINHSVDNPNNATNINFSDSGLSVTGVDNLPIFQVKPVLNAANLLQAEAVTTGAAARLNAIGTDANVDIMLQPKGSGVLSVSYGSVAATNAAGFTAQRSLAFKDGNGITWYIPLCTYAW